MTNSELIHLCYKSEGHVGKVQYISAIRSEVGPEKIDHISNKTIYQILLWKGVVVGMKG